MLNLAISRLEITIWVPESGVMGSEMIFGEICGGVNDAFTEDFGCCAFDWARYDGVSWAHGMVHSSL